MDRSKSYAGAGRMQIDPYYGDGEVRPYFRSYSYSAAEPEEVKRSGKSSSKRRWLALGDPDMDRKRRVASYKAYAVEGCVKGIKSFKWVKDRYLHLVHGWS